MHALTPHLTDPEACLLGAVICWPDRLPLVRAYITDAMISDLRRPIWTAVHRLADDDQTIDTLSVYRSIQPSRRQALLGELLDCVAAAGYQGPEVRRYLHPWLLGHADALEAVEVPGSLAREAADEIERCRRDASLMTGAAQATSLQSLTSEIREMLDAEWSEPEARTGIMGLDEMTNGLRPQRLIILGARPAEGKTALAISTAVETARRGHRVYYATAEMPQAELHQVLVACEAGVNSDRRYRSPGDERLFRRRLDAIEQWPIDYHETANLEAVCAGMRDSAQRGCKLAIVDYLQLLNVASARLNANRYELVGECSRTLKQLSRELNVPILALSQISREATGGAKPRLDHLRESGNLEQDADQVLFIYHGKDGLTGSPDATHESEVIVAKNRSGPTGSNPAAFRRTCSRWTSMSYADPLDMEMP